MEIKYEKKEHVINEKDDYLKWAIMMNDSGFAISLEELMHELHVSRNWVNEYIQPAVSYVKYKSSAKKWLGIKDASAVFFQEEELMEWLRDNATYTRQTKVIALDKIRSVDAIRDALEKAGVHMGFNGKRYVYGYVHPAITYELQLKSDNVNERERSKYPAVPVEKFNWWNTRKIHSADYSSTELAYREAFRNGCIKVSLLGKTIFVYDPNTPETRYPMTVPAK